MHKTLADKLTLTLSALVSSLALATPVAAQTKAWGGKCVESQINDRGEVSSVATIQGLECLIANVFIVFITLIGLAAFVMFIIASFRWLTSGGNTKGIETARNTMTFAVIGIVVALSAFIIINLISSFTGVTVIQQFRIPNSDTQHY
jgi:hypothetical protein